MCGSLLSYWDLSHLVLPCLTFSINGIEQDYLAWSQYNVFGPGIYAHLQLGISVSWYYKNGLASEPVQSDHTYSTQMCCIQYVAEKFLKMTFNLF